MVLFYICTFNKIRETKRDTKEVLKMETIVIPELPTQAGKAQLRYGNFSPPFIEGTTINLPISRSWLWLDEVVEIGTMKEGKTFLVEIRRGDDRGDTFFVKCWYGGEDENGEVFLREIIFSPEPLDRFSYTFTPLYHLKIWGENDYFLQKWLGRFPSGKRDIHR